MVLLPGMPRPSRQSRGGSSPITSTGSLQSQRQSFISRSTDRWSTLNCEPMIAEIVPESYDIEGRKVFRPDTKRHSGFRPTFPIGRFLSQPLHHPCSNFAEMRRFLWGCKYVSDQEQFGQKDYWQPPEQFEESKKGDCEDFALWAWRQLLQMGYDSRFVAGRSGRYAEGHAWVTFEKDGKYYLLEPLGAAVGLKLPPVHLSVQTKILGGLGRGEDYLLPARRQEIQRLPAADHRVVRRVAILLDKVLAAGSILDWKRTGEAAD